MSDEVLKELDAVALLEDLPTHGLVAGDVGTVVFVHHVVSGAPGFSSATRHALQ